MHESDSDKEDDDVMKMFLISENSCVLWLWNPLYTLACLSSSYYYAWISAFEPHLTYIPLVSVGFESAFAFNMLLCFLKEYTNDGDTTPVRDISKISMKYING